MPNGFGKRDYDDFAKENGLTFLGPLPITTTKPTNWSCNNCGRNITVSLASFRTKANRAKNHNSPYYSCQCRHNGVTSNEEARRRFAEFGMTLDYDLVPLGIHQKLPATVNATGERVECTLYWLYPTCSKLVIPKKIREIIGRDGDNDEYQEGQEHP